MYPKEISFTGLSSAVVLERSAAIQAFQANHVNRPMKALNVSSRSDPDLPWKVLLIGGSSGTGKTVVARQLAKQLSVSLLLLDDVRLALQQATNAQTHPDLHVFLRYPIEGWRNSDSIVADWIKVGNAMAEPLQAIIHHHRIVPGVGPLIIEGDGILPNTVSPFTQSKEVCSVFLIETDEKQLLENLRSRGRGFEEWGRLEQGSFAHASWRYGQWLAREAQALGLTVLSAGPQQTLLERLIAAVGVDEQSDANWL